ncbi:MAG: hypothetical protein JXA11_16325 [Phycisphaerae bacterium]|nr:hypothetical protein [Phycisphaerae bacterium]
MEVEIIDILLFFAIISLAILFFLKQQRKKGLIVLGWQYADTRTKEQDRPLSKPVIPSPMRYKLQKGQWGLLTIEPSELDTSLRELCAAYAQTPKYAQAKIRSAISYNEFYTLMEFARRSCVFALRDRDYDVLNSAFISIAMIEAEGVDYRDLLSALEFLRYSAERMGVDSSSTFLNFAKIAEPATAKWISGCARKKTVGRNSQESCGYFEVNTEYGAGFVSSGFQKYNPELDLLGIAMKIASAVEKDSYFVESIELATDLPSCWLEAPENENLQQTLHKIRGAATVTCRLEEDKYPEPWKQQFTLFVAEMDSEESAQILLEMSRKMKPKDYSMLGFSGGKLFALLITRSTMVGVDSFETEESIRRFIQPIDQIIQAGRACSPLHAQSA